MKKIQISFLFIGVLFAGHSYAQDFDEIGTRVFVESHCLAYAEVYRCFDIDESQCREMMSIIIPACAHDSTSSATDAEMQDVFSSCIYEAFIVQLGPGIDLDTPCDDW